MKWWPWTNLRWYKKHFPELNNLPIDLQTRLVNDSIQAVWKSRLYWLVFCSTLIVMNVWIDIAGGLIPKKSLGVLIQLSTLIPFATVVAFILPKLGFRLQKQQLHMKLNAMRIRPANCLLCQYDLRGTPDESTLCPECGAAIAAVLKGEANE